MNDQSTDTKIFEFSKQIINQVLDRIGGVTIVITDVTNQVKSLITTTSSLPTKQELINEFRQLNDVIDDKIIESLEEHHKDIKEINKEFFNKIISQLDAREKDHSVILEQLKEIEKKLDQIKEKSLLTIKIVLWFLFTGVPILFGIFTWITKK